MSAGALLPIALYLSKLGKKNFAESTQKDDVRNHLLMQKWLAIVLLKNAFGGSSDTTVKNLQDVLGEQADFSVFPYEAINRKLNIEARFSETEIDNLLSVNYSTKYSYLILSLLYPERDCKDNVYHEDHIFPKSEFTAKLLAKRGYDAATVVEYQKHFNGIGNLQLLTDKENFEKNATAFGDWLPTRDTHFKKRHSIADLPAYAFDDFLAFITARQVLIKDKLRVITM